MKTEERQLRAAGYTDEAAKLRKNWRKLTLDYEIYSIEHKRAFYRYRCVIDRAEEEESVDIKFYKWQKDIGKENMPKDVDSFREMLYNNPKEYQLLNHYDFARTTGRISALADYNLFKETKSKIEDATIGKVATNGTKIKSVSLHCVDRVIGTIYDVYVEKDGHRKKETKHEGMSIETFKRIFNEGVPQKEHSNADGSISQIIKLKDVGRIAVNKNTGRIIQCNIMGNSLSHKNK